MMNIERRYLLISCLLFIFLAAPAISYAVTVTNLNDMGAGSLRQAVIDTPGGGTVDFQAGLSGTITLMSGQITIDKALTITGPGADVITVSGNNSSRIFNITDSTVTVVAVDISGLTLANGQITGVGGAIFDGENLTLSDSVLVNNNCTTNGGAIFVDVLAILTLTRDTFTGNTAGQQGGAIGMNTNALVNSITDCEFTGNGAELSGGAIHNALGIITLISGTTFKSNTAINLANTADGGAISITGNTNQGRIDSIVNSTFYGNIASGNGGAIYTLPNGSNNGVIFLSFVTIAGNQAADGGGIYIDDIGNSTNKDIRNSILSDNSPTTAPGTRF